MKLAVVQQQFWMKEFDIFRGGEQNILWPLLHIFRGSGPPNPLRIYAPDRSLIESHSYSCSIRVGSNDLEWSWKAIQKGSKCLLEDFHNYGQMVWSRATIWWLQWQWSRFITRSISLMLYCFTLCRPIGLYVAAFSQFFVKRIVLYCMYQHSKQTDVIVFYRQ